MNNAEGDNSHARHTEMGTSFGNGIMRNANQKAIEIGEKPRRRIEKKPLLLFCWQHGESRLSRLILPIIV